MSRENFRLISLKLRNNTYFENIDLEFIRNKSKYQEDPFTTILIGTNGSGKSYLLRTIIDLFRELFYIKNHSERNYLVVGQFDLKYFYNDHLYCYRNMNPTKQEPGILDLKIHNLTDKKISFLLERDGNIIKSSDVYLPERVLASSIMLTDKYPISRTDKDYYIYLGIRRENSASVAGTRTYVRRTTEFIAQNINNQEFRSNLIQILKFLGFQEKLIISYVPRYRTIFFKKSLNINEFIDAFENWQDHFGNRNREPWGKTHFDKIKNDPKLLGKIVFFLTQLSDQIKPYGQGGRYFSYEIINDNSFFTDYPLINELDKLNLLSPPDIAVKKDTEFSFEQSSSGEAHLLSSFIGLMASIRPNSIILIDEPEISLHPNWQMSYINFLKTIFKNYKNCHFIIATHSHFLVSDLSPNSSSVISLSRDEKNCIKAENIKSNTFGWSAEEILYAVFKVKTTRNIYLEAELRELLHKIAIKSIETDRMKEILDNLQKLQLPAIDPLNLIIEKAEKYLTNDKKSNL